MSWNPFDRFNKKKKQEEQPKPQIPQSVAPAPQTAPASAPDPRYASVAKDQTFGNFLIDSMGKVSKVDKFIKQYSPTNSSTIPFGAFQSMIENKPDDIDADQLVSHLEKNYTVDGLNDLKDMYSKIGKVPWVNTDTTMGIDPGVIETTNDYTKSHPEIMKTLQWGDSQDHTLDSTSNYVSKDFFQKSVMELAKRQWKRPEDVAPLLLQKAMEAWYTIEWLNDQGMQQNDWNDNIDVGTSLKRTPAQMTEDENAVMKSLDWANIVGKGTEGLDNLAQMLPNFDVSAGRQDSVDQKVAELDPETRKKYEEDFAKDKTSQALYGNVEEYIRDKVKSFWDVAFWDFPMFANMMVNAPGSTVKLATATARGVTNPLDTVLGIAKLVATPEWHQAIMDRYGSIENFQHSIEQDPVGVASDILTVMWGWSSLLGKWAKIAGMTDTAGNLSRFGKTAMWASDMGVPGAIDMWLDKTIDLTKNIPGAKQATKTAATLAQPSRVLPKGLTSSKTVQDAIDYTAEKAMGQVEAQDKLFKAQNPSVNRLTRDVDFRNKRANSDLANEAIIEKWFTPTDTQTRMEAHEKTMESTWEEIKTKIWDNTHYRIDLVSVADKIDKFADEVAKSGVLENKPDVDRLKAQAKKFRSMGSVDLWQGEIIKERVNGLINNWGQSEIGDVYKNGMKQATFDISGQMNAKLSKIPNEFSALKKRFWALKDTYGDVVKANIKNQKDKGLGLGETFSRIEGIGDIFGGVFGMLSGKNPLPDIMKGWAKLVVGKTIAKMKDPDFLVEQGFKSLRAKAVEGGKAPTVKIEESPKDNPPKAWGETAQKENVIDIVFPDKNNTQPILDQYASKYGNIVNPDNFREFVDPSWKLSAADTHEPASSLSEQYFSKLLQQHKWGKWLVVAGWSWAGKWTSMGKLGIDKWYDVIVDKTVWNKELDKMVENWMKVDYYIVVPDARQVVTQIVGRAARSWRTLPIKSVGLQKHIEAPEFFKKAKDLDKYKDVNFRVIDNAGHVDDIKILEVDDAIQKLETYQWEIQSIARNNVKKIAKMALDNKKISPQQYRELIQGFIPLMVILGYLKTEEE